MRPNFSERLKALLPAIYVDVAKVIVGNFMGNGLHGLTKLVVAGYLAPRGLGILRSIYAIFRLSSTVVDFGLNYAVLSMVPAAVARDETEEGDRILKSVLALRLMISVAFLLAGYAFAGPIAISVLGDATLTVWVRLAFVAVIGRSLWKFVSGYLSADREFGKVAFYITTAPLVMLISVGTLALTDHFDLGPGILIYLFAPAATVLLWWPWIDHRFLRSAWSAATMRRVIRFGRWVYLSKIAMTSRSHVNPLLLKNPTLSGSLAAGELNAGLYSFGNELADELTVLTESLYMVLMPRAAEKKSPRAVKGFVKRCYRNLALLLVPLMLPVFLFKPFLMLLSTIKASYVEYLPSYDAFVILYAAGLLSLAIIPMRSALYALELPQVDSALESAGVVLMVAGGIVLIPIYGYIGAAFTVLAVRAIALVGVVAYGLVKLGRFENPAG